MPLLSVLIPLRNAGATAELAVRSTLRALPRDGELVVWDDDSEDDSVAQLECISDPRLRVIRSAESVGPGGAMQQLLDRTDSKFVARMDADDICLPWRFFAQLGPLRDDSCDYVFSPVISFRTRPLRMRPELPIPISATAMPFHLAVTNLLSQPSMTASRSAIQSAGGYRAMLASDYDLWLRACAQGQRLTRLWLPSVLYRMHTGQISASADYHSQVARSPQMQEAYRSFLNEVLGIDVPAGPGLDGRFPRADPSAIRSAILARSGDLRGVQRRLLYRTMRYLTVDSALTESDPTGGHAPQR